MYFVKDNVVRCWDKLTIDEICELDNNVLVPLKNIPDDGLIFLSDSQDVAELKESYPEYDSFFMYIDDSEVIFLLGMDGIVPYNWKLATKLDIDSNLSIF